MSQQIRILHKKRFFAHQLKGKPKHYPEFQRYCNICNYNIYVMGFSRQQAAMFVYGSIEDNMFDFLTGFFFFSLEMFFIH